MMLRCLYRASYLLNKSCNPFPCSALVFPYITMGVVCFLLSAEYFAWIVLPVVQFGISWDVDSLLLIVVLEQPNATASLLVNWS